MSYFDRFSLFFLRKSSRLPFIPLLLLVLSTSSTVLSTSAHYTHPSVSAFTIQPSDSGSTSVRLLSGISCTFTYKSVPDPLPIFLSRLNSVDVPSPSSPTSSPSPPSADVLLSHFLSSQTGRCISQRFEYWIYEVCFGSSIKQSHDNDIYMMGRTAKQVKLTQEYDDGDTCDAIGNKPRKTILSFVCKENARIPQIISVLESSACFYQVTIATSEVCSSSSFPIVKATDPIGSQTPSAPEVLDTSTEDWLLEAVELSDGSSMCSVKSLEYRSGYTGGSKLNFERWELKMENGGQTEVGKRKSIEYVARHLGRVDCGKEEVVVGEGSVRNSELFDGKLSLAKVYG